MACLSVHLPSLDALDIDDGDETTDEQGKLTESRGVQVLLTQWSVHTANSARLSFLSLSMAGPEPTSPK